ncbi:MAG: GWxTD domain-containing protein [Chitinophagales bacterium]
MKKFFTLTSSTVFFYFTLFFLSLITSATHAQALHAFMRNCAFLSVGADTPYVETYIAVPGFELTYVKNTAGAFEATLDISLDYMKDTAIIISDHYTLRTPEIADTSAISFNVLDLRRELLPQGDYTIRLTITDVNSPAALEVVSQNMKVEFKKGQVSLSDIELVQEYSATTSRNLYSKNGYDIHPLAISFYPDAISRLRFYTEIYNSSSIAGNNGVLIMYSVKNAQTGSVVNELFRFTRQKAATINYLFSEFDISDLPTGNYFLEVEVKNKKNETIARQEAYFQRLNQNSVYELSNISLINISNKFVNLLPGDSMKYYVSCLMPQAELFERDYIFTFRQKSDTLLMKQFFYNFWLRRNNTNPQAAWIAYSKMVDAVNYNYSTPVLHGFETDRGRVYLQYGQPSQLDGNDHEPNAYPYEIWQYYNIHNGQSNVRFVFCNADLVTNDYKLIHSDARGELNDPRWRFKIFNTFKESNGYGNPDQENYPGAYGSHVDDIFSR